MPRHGCGPASRPVRLLRLLPAFLVLPFLSACGEGDRPGPPPEQLPGVWIAIESEFVQVAPPRQSVDMVALGGSVTLILRPDGTFVLDVVAPGDTRPWRREGIWIDDWDVLRLEYTAGQMGVNEFDMRWRDEVLILRNADSNWNFGAGSEPAKWNLRMVKHGGS